MELRLRGRVALVTGGSKGIGRAIAITLAREGVNLMLVARSESELAKVRREISDVADVAVETFALDLGRSEAVATLAAHGSDVDILVNNAGAIPLGGILDIDEVRWREAWNLKLFGYINMTRAFYALMKARGSGVIINILGTSAERVEAGYLCGSTANAALLAFTRALGGASPADGIRVVAINPGATATERMTSAMRTQAQERFGDSEQWRSFLDHLPFRRAATPEEISYMVAMLASDLSSYTSGTAISIDGGIAYRGALF